MKSAVVIGAGVAGLAAAQVLSARFESVEVYEGPRPAQTDHLHVLLQSGQIILEELFPGIRKKLVEKGCTEIDWALDTIWENKTGVFPRYGSSVRALSLSRSLLVDTMRMMLDRDSVKFTQKSVPDLSTLNAALIVIAGGQNLSLLKLLGPGMVKEERQEINLTYRSMIFPKNETDMKDFKQYYYQLDPSAAGTGGVISPIDGNRVIATLIEKEEEVSECPGFEGFLEKARKIPSGTFAKILEKSAPLTELHVFRKKSIHRRTLDLEKLPENVIVIGDTLLSLNPIFGQGMTVALREALILKEMLKSGNFRSREFQRRCLKASLLPYRLSLLGSQTSGPLRYILQGYLILCQHSKTVHHLFLRQLHSLNLFPGRQR